MTLFNSIETNGQSFSYTKNNPIELGKVHWLRDYQQAIEQSKKSNLPIFILFQEVPGCSNCTTYGNTVLSHPMIVECIESCFVPLCIYNNLKGEDLRVLNKYSEPTWNNPVVRIVDSKGDDLIPRQPDFRNTSLLLSTMRDGIIRSGHQVPGYFDILREEVAANESMQLDEVYFSMYCFWSGEKEISAIPGVIQTEAGYMHGKEVVKVSYRKDQVSLDDLFTRSNKVGCADEIYGAVNKETNLQIKPKGKYSKDKEDKYYLYQSEYKAIPMSPLQKTKVNHLLAHNKKVEDILSPRQLSLLHNKSKSSNNIGSTLEEVWWVMK